MVNCLFEIESNRYPFYQVVEIEVISIKNGMIKYRVCIDSKTQPGCWRKWEPIREIKLSELISENRDSRIRSILE